MHISVASHKGGVGKTTTAVHLAGYLQQLGPTVLFDGDPIHNAIEWRDRGDGFPFHIADIRSAFKLSSPAASTLSHVLLPLAAATPLQLSRPASVLRAARI